jgi:hypothetical protein
MKDELQGKRQTFTPGNIEKTMKNAKNNAESE